MSNIKTFSGFPSVFGDFFNTDSVFNSDFFNKQGDAFFPAANIIEGKDNYRIELSVPGFKKEEIKVNLESDILTIKAETKSEKKEESEKYTRREFSSSSFKRSFQLPKAANAEKIEAKYENGILHLQIPKKNESLQAASREIGIV